MSNATGTNWSQATHWTPNGVPGDGDFADVATNTIINTDIGTVGNGIKRITISGGATLTRDTSPHAIYFASTGTNPTGSGSEFAPANDATMFGIFNFVGGTLSLVGTLDGNGQCTNTLTINSGNNSSPWYIVSRQTGSNLSVECIDGTHIGTSQSSYQGFSLSSGYQNFSLNVRYNRLTDMLGLNIPASDPTNWNINNNLWVSPRSDTSNALAIGVISGAAANVTSINVHDNTVVTPVNNTYFLALTAQPDSTSFRRNAVWGTSSASISLISAPTGSGHTILNSLAINSKSTSGPQTFAISSASTTIQASYSEGAFMATVKCSTASALTITGNFLSARGYSFNDQGIIQCSQPSALNINSNVLLYEDVDPTQPTLLSLLWDTNVNNNLWNHNTLLGPPCHNSGARGANAVGMNFGEPGSSGTGNIYKNNFLCGWTFGYEDDSNVAYASDFAGSGIHHNGYFDNTNDFFPVNGQGQGEANFWNGVNAHPNAVYAELTLSTSPQFIDPTRRLTTWDSALGGPGTVANVFDQLSRRSGFGGTYNTAYNIASLVSYTLQGFKPANIALRGAASDGSAIGAMPVFTGIRAISGRVRMAGRAR